MKSFWVISREAPDGVKEWHYSAFMEINMLNAALRITGTGNDQARWQGLLKKEHSATHWYLFDARYGTTYDIYMQDEMPAIEEEAPGRPNTKIFDARQIDLRHQAWKQEESRGKEREGFKKMPSQISFGF